MKTSQIAGVSIIAAADSRAALLTDVMIIACGNLQFCSSAILQFCIPGTLAAKVLVVVPLKAVINLSVVTSRQ